MRANRVPAVVLGLNPNALGTVRSLRRCGIPVIAIERAPGGWPDTNVWMSTRTRLCRKILMPARAGHDALLEQLVELGPSLSDVVVSLDGYEGKATNMAGGYQDRQEGQQAVINQRMCPLVWGEGELSQSV